MENHSLKHIVAESHIPFLRGVFEHAGIAVTYLSPDQFTPDAVYDADALIVRTRTRCDRALLADSSCRMIATATIGTDHIDLPWCAARGIDVANAPGCNAPAVAQYVAGSIATWFEPARFRSLTVGIIGVGHVGSLVNRWSKSLGLTTILCDPPRNEVEPGNNFTEFNQLLSRADILTFHTPLTKLPAPYPTYHLFNDSSASLLRGNQYLINSARGPVTHTESLLQALSTDQLSGIAVDCWENEPDINRKLLAKADIATPHIAGYSLQGKIRATQMAIDAICARFGLLPLRADSPVELRPIPDKITIEDALVAADRLRSDTVHLHNEPEAFEVLRNGYDLRCEPQQYPLTKR